MWQQNTAIPEMLFTQIWILKPFLIELVSKWNAPCVCIFKWSLVHKLDLQSVIDQANQWSEWPMHAWVILLPSSRQETPLPMEVWSTFEQHLVASFLSAGKAYSYPLWSTYLRWNSLMFSTVQPEEHLQGQAKSSGSRPLVLSGLQEIAPPAGS